MRLFAAGSGERMDVVFDVRFIAHVDQLAVDHRAKLHLDQRVVDVSGDPGVRSQLDSSSRMHIAFDVRRLCVCNQDVLLELRYCFELMAQCTEVVGLLIGDKSLALTQLVRAAREAGIADHVFCVNEPEDACRIWGQMDGLTR